MNFNIGLVRGNSRMNYKKLYRQALRRNSPTKWSPPDSLRHWATVIDSLMAISLTIWAILAFTPSNESVAGGFAVAVILNFFGCMGFAMVLGVVRIEAKVVDYWLQLRLPVTFHLCRLADYLAQSIRPLFTFRGFDLNNPRTLVLVISEVEAGALKKRNVELAAIQAEQIKLNAIISKMASLIDRMKQRIGSQGDELSQLRLLEAEQGYEHLSALLNQFGDCEQTCQQQYASLVAVLTDLRDKHALADELQTITEGQLQYQQSSRVLELVNADLGKIQRENQRLLEVFGEVRDQRLALARACQEAGYSTDSHQEISEINNLR